MANIKKIEKTFDSLSPEQKKEQMHAVKYIMNLASVSKINVDFANGS